MLRNSQLLFKIREILWFGLVEKTETSDACLLTNKQNHKLFLTLTKVCLLSKPNGTLMCL